jgi:predicted dehydrogenase
VAAARQRPQQIFQVGYMKRYNAGFRLVKELLPRLGEIASAHIRVLVSTGSRRGESWYQQPAQSGGGLLTHSGSHLLDVTRMLFCDPVRVDSRVRYAPEIEGLDWLSLTLMDMADGLSIYFSTIGVPIAKVGHTQQGWEETIEIIGTKGRIQLSSPNWQGTLPCVVTLQLAGESQVRTIFPDPVSQWETQMRAFLESVQTRRQIHPDVVDGYKVDEIIGCIYESGRQRAPVDIQWRC